MSMNDLPPGLTLDEPVTPTLKLDDLPEGLTLDPQYSMGERAVAYGQRLARGAKNLFGGAMQGIAEALPEDEGNVFRQRAGRLMQEGKSYEEAKAIAEEERVSGRAAAPRSPTKTPLYRAGTAVNEFGKDYLTPGPAGEGFVGDLAEGAGSMVAGMATGGLPKVGAAVAGAAFTGSGAGEAAERARAAGATDAQTLEAARQGIVPGLTDLADVELARRVMGTGTLTQRLIRGLVTGGIVEGTQEGVQQFMQNMIARGIYKPAQDLWEGVAYNALLGAILGGGAKATIEGVTGGKTEPAPQPAASPTASLFGATPANAATRIQSPTTIPPAQPTPTPPTAPIVPNDQLPPFMGGPPLTEEEKNGLQLEREIRRQELQTLDVASPDFRHAAARLKNISLQLKSAEESETAPIPSDLQVAPPVPAKTNFALTPEAEAGLQRTRDVLYPGQPALPTGLTLDDSPPTSSTPEISPLHALTRRRLDAFDALATAARAGNLDEMRRAKAALKQVEAEWAAAVPQAEPEFDNDPNAPQREAWHGSPARHSGFQAEYLRSGEGNMMKGHGFYFAQARGVSESYTRLAEARKVADIFVKRSEGDLVAATRQLRDTLARAPESMRRDYQSALDILEGREPENTLYHVDIAAEREHLLDFDAPWAQQSKYVRNALDTLRNSSEFKAMEKSDIRAGASWRGQTGEAIYNEISRVLSVNPKVHGFADSEQATSELLLKYGIPGSMFLDQFSRRGYTKADLQKQLDAAYTEAAARMKNPAYAGSGAAIGRHIKDLERQVKEAPEQLTRNFVIFDPKKVTILTRNGQPLLEQPTGMIRQAIGVKGDRFAVGKEAISKFLNSDRRNAWVEVPEGQMYLRQTHRPRLGTVVDVSNLSFEDRSTGAFTAYLDHIEQQVLLKTKLEGIYVENIFNERLIPFLERRGYVRDGHGEPPSLVMPKSRLEILKRPALSVSGPPSIEQTAQTAIHYGNLHLAVYNEETKEVHVSQPVSLTGEVPQHLIPSDNVILHDDTIIEFAPGNQKMFSEIGQEKFGKRFDEYNYGVGEVFKGLRERVAQIMSNEGYGGILTEAVGVSFGFGYRNQGIPVPGLAHGGGWHGVSFKKFPFSGYFVNPFLAHISGTAEEVATSLMTTMVHEFAHHKERRENVGHGPFAHEMQAIQIRLAVDPLRIYEKLKNALTLHVRDHWDVYTEMERIPHVHDVRPLSSSKLWGTSAQSARNASIPRNNGGLGFRGGSHTGGDRTVSTGETGVGAVPDDGGVSVSYAGYNTARDNGTSTNQRALGAIGTSKEVPTVPIQPVTAGLRTGLKRLFATGSGGGAARTAGPGGSVPPGQGSGNIGGLPPTVAAAAAQADSMNWFWKFWYGLDQAADNNPNFPPIVRYRETAQRMHLEESQVHDMSLRISRKWQSLSPVQNTALTDVIQDVTNMTYLTPQERAVGVVRRATPQEEQALFQQHKLKGKGQEVYTEMNKSFDTFLDAIARNAVEEIQRNVTDPKKLQVELQKVADQVQQVKSKPFFPFRRFGSHYIEVKNSAGQSVLTETFERRGILPARYFQKKRAAELKKQFPGHQIIENTFAAEADPLTAMPGLLLQSMQGQMTMTPAQMKSAQLLQMTSARHFATRFKGSKLSGYSMDLLRSYSKFFFHAGRYYAHTKYAWRLRGNISMARAVQTNKASALADYMEDHLKNTILDVRGDFGKLKGFIFLYGLGYSPAAATANMTQLPMIVLPLFNAKFGVTKGAPALIKAIGQFQNYYRRGAYAGQTNFVSRALEYGIQTGRITEAQAPELAGLSMANNLNNSVLGTRAQRGWKHFFEKSSWLFEMSEQMVRRITYRAALDLAIKNPKSKATQEAVKSHPDEVKALEKKFSPAEAQAIVTAAYMTESPNFIYAKWARPRAFRHPVASVVLVFQKYMQSLLTLMKTHPTDFLPQYLLINMFVYGLMGFPGADDLRDIVKALASKWFGKHYDIEKEARKYILEISGGAVEPDLILHGMSRKGWGLPALIDLMGEKPGRGLTKDFQPGQNVPFPQFDRSRTGASKILPFDLDKLLDPQGNPNTAMGEQGARASGAVFSVGFNFYKFIEDSHHGWTDPKPYEKILPRFLKDATGAYRMFDEGRERGSRGGPASADTIVPYDRHDTEHMMELIGKAMGYQPFRQSEKWGQIMAQAEVEKFYDAARIGLMEQFAEMVAADNAKGKEDVRLAIVKYNEELPEWARGKAISSDALHQSIETRTRSKIANESGVPVKASDVGIARHVQELYPGAVVDVRKVK